MLFRSLEQLSKLGFIRFIEGKSDKEIVSDIKELQQLVVPRELMCEIELSNNKTYEILIDRWLRYVA